MDKTPLKKEFQERFLILRKIVNSWDLFPGSHKDEFDYLNNKILGHLYKGADHEKIIRVLSSELAIYYGLTADNDTIQKLTEEIFDWWNTNDSLSEI